MLSMSDTLPNRQDAVNSDEAAARTPAGDALSELVVHVFRLDGMLKTAGDALAEPAGQTSARWRVLAALDYGPMTVAQIARAWWLARQSVQRVADLLERDGLVSYEQNPAHRRAQLVRLTPRGRAALTRIRAAQCEWANTLGDRIGTDDLRTANQILARVIEALTDAA
jgi:DNA-binding MarR family transcriptional regulator